MPLYEYRCDGCGEIEVLQRIRDDALEVCPICDEGGIRRCYKAVQIAPVMQEHFNHAIGKVISDKKTFVSELARKSDEMTERTGIPHNYVEVDLSEKEALGATEEGMDSTMRRRTETGQREAKKVFYGDSAKN